MDHVQRKPQISRIVVVIPAYNEERFIASVVINARQHSDDVIVVDDGSHDRTAFIAEQAGATVIRMSKNGGKGAALNAGFETARQLSPAVVIMLDADAQHDPAEIPTVAEPILQGQADVVVGSRFLSVKSKIPVWRQFGQHALNIATNAASGVAITDTQSGYRAFSQAALEMMRFRSKGLAVESEMQFLLSGAGLRVAEVPITVQYLDGNKRNPVTHGLKVLDAILTLASRKRPLLFFAMPGTLAAILGLILGYMAIHQINNHDGVPVGTLIMASAGLIIGLLLAVTGIMLNSFTKLTDQIRSEIAASLSPRGNR